MKNLKSLLVVVSLSLLALPASAALGQTRRSTASRRAGRTAAAKPRAGAPCPASAAITTPSGLTYVITRRGTGKQPKAGDTVLVHYTGLLTSGVKFDSSLDRGEPIDFPLGRGMVIKGWDEGIAQLRVGDQAMLIIPPQIGYGERGAGGGVIPPNATLIFVVELMGVREAAPAGAPAPGAN